jgi:hypothetical protein
VHSRDVHESIPQIPPRHRITASARVAIGAAVADGGRTVIQAARDFEVSWPVAQAAFTTQAAAVLPTDTPPVEHLGIDETRRGKPRFRRVQADGGDTWEVTADRWHIGFADLSDGAGLLGQMEGRTAQAVSNWLEAQSAEWRAGVKVVAIDMCKVFKAAIRRSRTPTRFRASFQSSWLMIVEVREGTSTGASVGSSLALASCANTRAQWFTLPAGADAAGPTGPVDSGITGMCLDVSGGNSIDFTSADLYTCNATPAQQWSLELDGTILSLGKCLDVNGGGTTSGTTVDLYTCNGTSAQQWQWSSTGTYGQSLKNLQSGLCLDDPGATTKPGTQLQIYTCNGTIAQVWRLP